MKPCLHKQILTVALILLAVALTGCGSTPSNRNGSAGDNDPIARAFNTGTSNVQVEGEGVVTRILSDDVKGSRHQRFVLRLSSGQTVLITHNIDLAPRVDDLREGDSVEFNGEYVWNAQGGLVHWTHRDPAGRHMTGWLKHNGRIYQ